MLNDSDDESDEDDDLKVPSPAVEMKALLGSAKVNCFYEFMYPVLL